MTAVSVDMRIEARADYNLSLVWQDAAGVPVNLTGYTAKAQARATPDAVSTLFSLTQASGITLGGSAGTIAIRVAAAVTATLPLGSVGYWDLLLTSGTGAVTRLVEGAVTVTPGISQ